MTDAIRLTEHDLGRDDGCEECPTPSGDAAMFLVEQPSEPVDQVLCGPCVRKIHPGLCLPIGAVVVAKINGATIEGLSPVELLLASSHEAEEAPAPDNAAFCEHCDSPCDATVGVCVGCLEPAPAPPPLAMPVKGALYMEDGRVYRVADVHRSDESVTLVLQDLDDPQHHRTRQVKP